MKGIISAKQVQLAIKNGLTPEEMCEKYGISIDELNSQIKHLYTNSSKAQEILSQLKANRKKPHRRSKEQKPSSEPEQTDMEGPSSESGAKTLPDKTLSDLQKEEKQLSSEVIELESEHKKLSGQHQAYIEKLRNLQSQIENINKTLIDCETTFNDIAAKADAIVAQMNNVSTLRKNKLAALNGVRQEIEVKNTVYVTADGSIEAPFVMNDEGFETILAEIVKREEYADFRVRDLKAIARLIKIYEHIESVERLTLICDRKEVEDAFWAIRPSYTAN